MRFHLWFFALLAVVLSSSENSNDHDPVSVDTVHSHLDAAKVFLIKQQYNQAIEEYDKAIALDKQNYLSYFKRATAYLTMGKSEKAAVDFSNVLFLKPDFDQALLQRGKVYLQTGDLENAINDLGKYVSHNKQEETAMQLLVDAENAQTFYKKALDGKDSCKDVIEFLSEVVSISPHHVDARMERARCFHELGDLEMAVGDYLRSSKLRPDNTVALFKMSTIRVTLGEIPDAISSLKECLKFDMDHKECKKKFRELKKVDKQMKRVEELVSKELWKTIIRTILGDNEDPGTLKTIQDLEIGGKVPVQLYEALCRAYANGDNEQKNTLLYCQKTLDLDPENLEALLAKAEVSMEKEEFEDAMRDYKKAHEATNDRRASEGYNKAQRLHKQAGQKNYYKVLGVNRNASKREIKRAYRKLAQKWHPDKHESGEKKDAATKKMSEINEAYDVLKNDELRERFDNGDDPNSQEQYSQPNFNQFFQGGGHPFGSGGGGFKFHFGGF